MNTEIKKIKGSWEEVVDDCRATVGKPPLGHEPSEDFKRRILIAEHGPIRTISVKWVWHGIKSWIATHWSRHKWECCISTQRSDRTGILRDKLTQDAPVNFVGEANVPNCVYRCGCPELHPCGMYEWWLKFHPEISSTNIQERYDKYNELFRKARGKA